MPSMRWYSALFIDEKRDHFLVNKDIKRLPPQKATENPLT